MKSNVRAVFRRAANLDGTPNEDESYWIVWDDDIKLVQITVKQLCNKDPELNYNIIATKEFGRILLKKVTNMKAYW